MERWRWRSMGVAIWLTALVALAAGLIEVFGPRPMDPSAPGLRDLPYALDLHLLAAVGVTLGLRALFRRAAETTFPSIALGGMLMLELGVVGVHWLIKVPFLPRFYTPAGKAVAAIAFLAAIVLGLVLARLVARALRRETWIRWTRGLWGVSGIGLAIAILGLNAVLFLTAMPRPVRSAVRSYAAGHPRPDVFIILVDTLRRDHLSYFGYPRPTSPNIDRLLSESVVFTAASTPSTWTIPSVASLFTGLYPTSHQVTGATNRIAADAPLLAEHFRSYGYRTGAFVANQIVTRRNGYGQGFEAFFPPSPPWWTYHQLTAFERLASRVRKPASASQGWRINQEFLRWLKATPDQPHFAYLHYLDPHSPYEPPAEDLQAVAPDAPRGPADPPRIRAYVNQIRDPTCRDWECLESPPSLPPEELAGMIARYDAEIRYTDRMIGALLDKLGRTGALERCHILFLTDHGEEFADHHGWSHGNSIYEEMIGCPMAYRPPGGRPGGGTIARPTPELDLLLTLCRILGLDDPPLHQGREIPELLGRPAPATVPPVLSEIPPHLYALRQGPWKLIRRGSTHSPDWRLYNLQDDPGELHDVADTYPDTLAALRGYLEGRLAELAKVTLMEISSTTDPELLERLRSLGYIQ
jgi:arylsulfatase A-like enzyme